MKVLGPFNGFYVLHFPMPNTICSIRAVTHATGSLYEHHKGVAHFLEHCFFKRTKNKNEKQISAELDLLGSHNASTNYDDTIFYINCRNKKWHQAFSLLNEMLFESEFNPTELEVEKQVILKEENTRTSDPVSYFFDNAIPSAFIYRDSGIKVHSIIGDVNSIQSINVESLIKHKNDLYSKSNIFFTISGNISEEDVIEHCSNVLSKYVVSNGEKRKVDNFNFDTNPLHLTHESAEQAVFCLSWLGYNEEQSLKNNLVDSVFSLGFGGMSSSILYERIRQELGMCYEVGHYVSNSISKNKFNSSYGLTTPDCVDTAIEETHQLFKKVIQHGFESKLDVVKENILHRFCAISESSSSFSSYFGDNWMSRQCHLTLDEILNKIEKVENKDICAYAEYLYSQPHKLMTLNKG